MTMRTILVSAALLAAHAGAAHAQCPGGSCTAPRYVHPVHAAPVATPRGAAPSGPPTYGPDVPPPTPPLKRWVWLRSQSCWGFGWRRADGLWVIDPGSKRKPGGPRGTSDRPGDEPGLDPTMLAPPDHRQAFLGHLNSWRAQHGLAPCGYSEDLEQWALANSATQARVGASGHYVSNLGWYQVAFHGPTCPEQAMQGWIASPDHNAALLEPSATMIGVGVIGSSWTVNLR